MTSRFALIFISLCMGVWLSGRAGAETFQLNNGEVLNGDPISFNPEGLVVKKADGSFASRVAWTNFTEATLKQLLTLPKAKAFVEPYVESEEDLPARKVALEIKPKPVTRLDRPSGPFAWARVTETPVGLMILAILLAANLYAAYEVSLFRNYPSVLVCGVSLVVPVLAPILFLCLPTRLRPDARLTAQMETQEQVAAERAAGPEFHVAAEPVPERAAVSALPPTLTFQRGQTTFNRRFFETKLSGFLRVVPTEAEKDMLIHIKCVRGEYTGTRITRIMPNEVYLQVTKNNASTDVIIPFAEISLLEIRHKDA